MKHGDGVKDIAFEVEDCVKLYHVSIRHPFFDPIFLLWKAEQRDVRQRQQLGL